MNLRSFLTQSVFNLFEKLETSTIFENHFILEIKYSKVLPAWIPDTIKKYNLKNEAVSKYALCVDKHLQNKFFIYNF